MTREVPGTTHVDGRGFLYVEASSDETVRDILSAVLSENDEIAMPKSGGALEEKVRLTLKDGLSLIGLSFKGDLEGWRAKLVGYFESSGRKYGKISDSDLVLSSGVTLSLDEVQVDFYD